MSTKMIDLKVVNTVAELNKVLDLFTCRVTSPDPTEINVTNEDGDPAWIRLFEETLSDGSKIYNLRIA
jgi:hypothetical protein